ncbi:MAG: EF-hand domain-containing protein [Alphaproteobacteria bacterium]|nr:MAG: EF-hand domain-containing protein [Alphaproteobacteria bacterium]
MPTIDGLGALATGLTKLRTDFKTADTNTDGALTLAEFEAAAKSNTGLNGDRGQSASITFKQLDTNGNGLLTSAELTQGINLSTQVQAVLIQGQQLQSSYLGLLGGAPQQTSLFGSSNNFGGLTSSLLGGGSASSSLTTLYSGGNLGTSLMEGLFGGGGTNALVQQYLERYNQTLQLPTTGQSA